jgi:hypothetical protein
MGGVEGMVADEVRRVVERKRRGPRLAGRRLWER